MDVSTTVYTGYDNSNDITIIYEDTWINNELVSTEIKGFYYGGENEVCTEKFYGTLKATYNKED